MRDIKIKFVKNSDELNLAYQIRENVFIKEQGVSRNMERDKFDKVAKHIIVFFKNNPIGCARIRFVNGKAKLERIALLRNYRGKGIGKKVIDYLIVYCKNKKIKKIYMNSQYYLKNYYAKFGFEPIGKPFMEAGIKHIKMNLKN